uniref:DUF5302 domain-containing protein n=1 Tax=Nocardia cyriacigeorgica TaxID=135487 RepID=UPI00245556F1
MSESSGSHSSADEVKRKFREALERKNEHHAQSAAHRHRGRRTGEHRLLIGAQRGQFRAIGLRVGGLARGTAPAHALPDRQQ